MFLLLVATVYSTVEVNLDAPRRPFPQLAAEIELLDERRDSILQWQIFNLTHIYQQETMRYPRLIDEAIKHGLSFYDDKPLLDIHKHVASFLQSAEFRVEVAPHKAHLNAEVPGKVRNFETYRETYANMTFESGVRLIRDVTREVVETLNDTMRIQIRPLLQLKQVSLMQMRAIKEVNSRCIQLQDTYPNMRCNNISHPFLSTSLLEIPQPSHGGTPTIAKMLEDLQLRRDVAEDLFTQQVLIIATTLASEELNYVSNALAMNVATILDQYKDVIRDIVAKNQ